MSIHPEGVLSRKRVASLGAWLVLSGMLLLPGHGIAQIITLTDAGSTATVNLGSSAGMNSWTVSGQNQLEQQWFWYRTGGGIAQPVNTIGGLTYNQNAGLNTLDATYQNDQLLVEIIYTLTGGGINSGNADMDEQIMVINQSSSDLNLNFYQYSHFNLLGAANDYVQIFGSTGDHNYVRQNNGSTAIQEAINAPSAFYAEAAPINQTLAELNSINGLTLNENLTEGPGNVTWALQWISTLAADGGELDLTKDKSLSIQLVPEPSTVAIIAMGAGALGLALRRKLS
jgi:hypothetical protein